MNRTVLFGILVIAAVYGTSLKATSGPDVTDDCGNGYSQPVNSNWSYCYKVYTRDDFMDEATETCENDKGTLVSIPDAFVNTYIYQLSSQQGVLYVTLGIRCQSGTKNCYNIDGSKFTYSNWAPGEPDSSSRECVYMSTTVQNRMKWTSMTCSGGQFFACQKPAAHVQEYVCPQNYVSYNGECYRFVSVLPNKISANNASIECQKIAGGDLASIGDYHLDEFLAGLDPFKNKHTAFGLTCPDIESDGDTHSCRWRDGSSLGYSGFYPRGYPTKSYRGGGCCDFANGKWKICIPCDDNDYFDSYICEAPEKRL